jgi:hypothetical protein
MLYDVRDVGIARRDPRALQTLVEHAPGGADERMPLDVLAVTGLLADQHHAGAQTAFAHHCLGRSFVQVAGAARLHSGVEVRQTRALGDRRVGSVGHRGDWLPGR